MPRLIFKDNIKEDTFPGLCGDLVACCEHGMDEGATELDEGTGDAAYDEDVHRFSDEKHE